MNYRRKEKKAMIRKMLLISSILSILLFSTSCGDEEKKPADSPTSFEIALITDSSGTEDDSFARSTWKAITDFGDEYGLTYRYHSTDTDERSSEKDVSKACAEAADIVIGDGAKLIIFAGSQFETAVHSLQKEHEDIYFMLIDGVPRDGDFNYELAPNSTGVLFAEEEAGFLAGYAAVADGYTKLGFAGGEELPPVKRYGYGFIQGAATAAREKKVSDVRIRYTYTDTFHAQDWIRDGAGAWYADGTEVVFACGGSICHSIIEAAEGSEGKVIGVDTDQSALSDTVITSAKKEIRTAVFDILKTYIHGNFKGNSIFNYNLKNNGVSLEVANSHFDHFSKNEYMQLIKDIKTGALTVKKEMGEKSLEELASEEIKVEKDDFAAPRQ